MLDTPKFLPTDGLELFDPDSSGHGYSKPFVEFVRQVQRKIRGSVIYNAGSGCGCDSSGVYVALQNYPFVLGSLGYDNYTNSGGYTKYFTVASAHIHNDKYAFYSIQRNYLMSTDVTRAVRNATRNLRKFSDADVFNAVFGTFSTESYHLRNSVEAEADEKKARLLGLNPRFDRSEAATVFPTVRKLVEALPDDGSLMDPEMAEFISAAKELFYDLDTNYPAYTDAQAAVLYTTGSGITMLTRSGGSAVATHYAQEEIPDWVMGKVSVLSVLDTNQEKFVENVGLRYSDSIYCVYMPEQ